MGRSGWSGRDTGWTHTDSLPQSEQILLSAHTHKPSEAPQTPGHTSHPPGDPQSHSSPAGSFLAEAALHTGGLTHSSHHSLLSPHATSRPSEAQTHSDPLLRTLWALITFTHRPTHPPRRFRTTGQEAHTGPAPQGSCPAQGHGPITRNAPGSQGHFRTAGPGCELLLPLSLPWPCRAFRTLSFFPSGNTWH